MKPTIHSIKRHTAACFQITPEDIEGPCRIRRFVRPRHISIFLSRQLTKGSLNAIGMKHGGRDHQTIAHSIDMAAILIERDSDLRIQVDTLKQKILMAAQ